MAISDSDSSSTESVVSPPPANPASLGSASKQDATESRQGESSHDNDLSSVEQSEESGQVKQAVDQVEKQQRQSALHLSFRNGLQHSRDPKTMFAAARNAVRASLSPRSKSSKPFSTATTKPATTDTPTSPRVAGAVVAPIRTAFDAQTMAKQDAPENAPPDIKQLDQQPQAVISSLPQHTVPREILLPTTKTLRSSVAIKVDTTDLHPPNDSTIGRGFVDEVRDRLDELVSLLDSVDPKKLVAIRLGGELRGLLGKAQDEFYAYESSFADYAGHVGVSIALQNFAASLHQVYGLATRLQAAKFLLNKTFKREVTFAFQEINSYYTSLFMELSMAVARRSGIELPLPSPVKPQPPPPATEPDSAQAPVPVTTAVATTQTVEHPSPEPEYPQHDRICFEAHMHFFGHGVIQDRSKARDLYKAAAEMGNVQAMVCLGQMHMTGENSGFGEVVCKKDLLVAEKWLERATALGNTDAATFLGRLLCEKVESATNEDSRVAFYSLAHAQFSMAADRGHPFAQYCFGDLIERGLTGSTPDAVTAAVWYEKAAVRENTLAEAALGRLYCRGGSKEVTSSSAFAKDITKAIHFLHRAAAKGDIESQTLLGIIYCNGEGVKRDVDRGIEFLRSAANKGSPDAMTRLALVLLGSISLGRSGDGETPTFPSPIPTSLRFGDREEIHDDALRLLLNASTIPVTPNDYSKFSRPSCALFALGELLETSTMLTDRTASLRFYSKAAVASPCHVLAARRAAAMQYSGVGCPADKNRARQLYALAADAGDADALNALGLMCEEGEGGDLDLKQAASCYRAAVARGHAHAHFNLGHLLARGRGVRRDPDAARAHFEQAAALGYTLAHQFLPTI